MVTPTASDTRKNAASEASSFSSVVRATSPASSATTRPAIRPPAVIANRLRPANRNPTAAPGRIACAIASPIRLMRRSIRNTPTGPAPNASANAPTSARRMNSYSTNGPIRRSYMKATPSGRALDGLVVERLAHAACLEQVLRRQDLAGLAPSHRLARQQQDFGEMRAHHLEV